MCIIIDNSNKAGVSAEIARRCVNINKDGFGFFDLETGKLTRTMDMKVAEGMIRSSGSFIAHCRYATQGKTTLDNVHPFLTHDGSYLFQNGTIDGFSQRIESDTRQLSELLKFVKPENLKEFLSSFECRFLLVHRDLSILRTGDWVEHEGTWYSKDNVLPWTPPEKSGDWKSWSSTTREFGYYDSGDYDDFSTWAGKSYKKAPRIAAPKHGKRDDSTLVAVYGTLRYGYGNHDHYLGKSDLIAEGTTSNKYRLCVTGLPYLIEGVDQCGEFVEVEVYRVDSRTLSKIDKLEGHPTHYKRSKVLIDSYGGEMLDCWIYMVGKEYDSGTYYKSYDEALWQIEEQRVESQRTTKKKQAVMIDDDDDTYIIVDEDDKKPDSPPKQEGWYDNHQIRVFHV